MRERRIACAPTTGKRADPGGSRSGTASAIRGDEAKEITMGNIQVKNNGPQQTTMATTLPTMSWDPSRWFTKMMGYDPFREMSPLLGDGRFAFEPAFEIKETKEGYLFRADVPGVKSEDIDVSVTGSRIQISGKREAEKEEKGETFYTYERSYGSFSRAFTLPDGVDGSKIRADLRDGVLSVLAPKMPESMPKKIPVATSGPTEKKS